MSSTKISSRGSIKKPDSYRELADHFEWAKREPWQDVQGHVYDECNVFLDRILAGETDKVIVEGGCGQGRNLHRYAGVNRCIGVDFSTTCLTKIASYGSGVAPVKADIRHFPVKDGGADYVILCNVLFIYQDLDEIAAMLGAARRMLKPGGKLIMINDFCSVAVRVAPFLGQNWIPRRGSGKNGSKSEFMLYYFTDADSRSLLQRAGLETLHIHHCNTHSGVYHATYLSPLFGALMRSHRRHRRVRRMDHWRRVHSGWDVNDAYPLNPLGRAVALFSQAWWRRLSALSICCLATPTH